MDEQSYCPNCNPDSDDVEDVIVVRHDQTETGYDGTWKRWVTEDYDLRCPHCGHEWHDQTYFIYDASEEDI